MESVRYSDVRGNLRKLMDQTVASRDPIRIKRRGGKDVVLVSARAWAGMEETLYLMSSPANAQRLLEGIKQLDAGLGEVHELIRP